MRATAALVHLEDEVYIKRDWFKTGWVRVSKDMIVTDDDGMIPEMFTSREPPRQVITVCLTKITVNEDEVHSAIDEIEKDKEALGDEAATLLGGIKVVTEKLNEEVSYYGFESALTLQDFYGIQVQMEVRGTGMLSGKGGDKRLPTIWQFLEKVFQGYDPEAEKKNGEPGS